MATTLMHTTGPFLCVDLDVRARYHAAGGMLRRRLEHLIWIARNLERHVDYRLQALRVVPEGVVRPDLRPDEGTYCFLAYLLTGDEDFAVAARKQLRAVADGVSRRERTDSAQMHTHCDAFPMARWLLLYDWVRRSPVFTPADHAYLQERFLYYLWAHPFQRLKARPVELTPANNQNGAMGFACALGGYLFGVKHHQDPGARRLLDAGYEHLARFLTAFPAGGYSFEGSAYMAGVNAFILPLGLELAAAITGEDFLDRRHNADCASPREVLAAIMRLMSPGGLLHPWDNYGYGRPGFTPTAAYLAWRTGETGPLDHLERIGALDSPRHLGWGFDKTLWTLLWALQAPRPAEPSPAWCFNHAESTVAATAAGPRQRLFVMQMWDRSYWPPNRSQFNPNSLIAEFDGFPLLLDGACVESAKHDDLDRPECRTWYADLNEETNFGGGTVGVHNCVFLDDDAYFAPHRSTQGELLYAQYAADTALFEADVTTCFAPEYDVVSVRRATLLLGDDALLVRDRIVSPHPRRVTWRAHLRDGEAVLAGTRFAVVTAEQIRLEVCTPDGAPLAHRHFSGAVASQLEGSCHEVSHHAVGDDVMLYTLFVATPGMREWLDCSDRWGFVLATSPEMAASLRAAWPGGEPLDTTDGAWFYAMQQHAPGIGVYHRTVTLPQAPATRVWLRIPQLIRSATVWVNDTAFAIDIPPEGQPLLPHVLEVGPALRAGENTLMLHVPSTLEAAVCGRIVLLCEEPEGPASSLARDGDSLELRYHGRTDRVVWSADQVVIDRGTDDRISVPRKRTDEPAPRRQPFPAPALAKTPPRTPPGARELAAAIAGSDWRTALRALEAAVGCTEEAVVAAALALLQSEADDHVTLPDRKPDDVCWYRLKAAAAEVLGAAVHAPAVPLLVRLLHSDDIYPVRVACAHALARIGTDAARAALAAVDNNDEINTVTVARQGQTSNRNQTEGTP